MRASRLVIAGALIGGVLGACSGGDKKPPDPGSGTGSGVARPDGGGSGGGEMPVLPPAPPVPPVPAGLPPLATAAAITPEAVALGELLFWDPRLSPARTTACATCHDPAHGFAGEGRQETAGGKPNLRRAPALVNLAWQKELGWDGRYPQLGAQLAAHARGQLGDDLAGAVARISEVPGYRAHFARMGTAPTDAAATALAAYVLTRYAGSSQWDRAERAPIELPDLVAGYRLFTDRARCATCHTPPLYTDLGYHRLGLIASPDDGRGLVEPREKGAFKTPTLRGAAEREGFFHDGSATSLDAAIDWHLAGGTGQGADPSIVDPALKKVTLTPAERAQLGAFVRALSDPAAPVPRKPELP